MSEFTKGPWVTEVTKNDPFIQDQSWVVCKKEKIAICQLPHKHKDMQANAHLIAAAPELYEMLEELSSQLTDINAHSAVNDIEKLLAKARGEL